MVRRHGTLPKTWLAVGRDQWQAHHLVSMTLLEILTVHGNLCLALKHPKNYGPSRRVIEHVLNELEIILDMANVPIPEGGWRADGPRETS